jgi:D-3-phosphoglycerate dehydrogenase / 2-oxoglutarate reductase
MKKILTNDGIDAKGKQLLETAGFTVETTKVPQADLIAYINANNIAVLTVRSATQVRKDIIDACPNLKVIARGGVGMDNIDVEYARSKGVEVINTPAASSLSVAELVFAHLFSLARFLNDAHVNMPLAGHEKFDALKKQYAGGFELRGKTIGIIGFGRIGQEVAKIALGLGMNVIANDAFTKEATLTLPIAALNNPTVTIATTSLDTIITEADFITIHIPGGELINAEQLARMKKNAVLINASRGGVINETDLINALDNGTIAYAALDVFTNEPTPNTALLQHKKISTTPHIGAATLEAQERIGEELAARIISFFNN